MPEPTLTSKNLPPVQQPTNIPGLKPAAEVQIPYGDIVAKPLRAPNFLNLKPKNPNMSLFFGNRAVGEKESGLRYDQLIAMGFIPAKPDQVLTSEGLACPPSICRDGRVMYGDLILLIIPRADYVGALKWNEQNARLRVKKTGVSIEGDTQKADARLQPVSTTADLERKSQGKVSAYVPSLAETDSRTADNSGPLNLADPPKR